MISSLRRPLAAFLALLAAAALSAAPADAQPLDREALRAEIRAYLLEHPDVIVEALQALEERNRRAALGQLTELVDAGELVASAGAEAAPDVLTLIELTDYNCPYCRRAQPEIQAFLANDAKVRHIVKVLPYIGDDIPERAAVAATLQDAPERQRAFHQAMMSHQGPLDVEAVVRLAEEAGLDGDALRLDMDSEEVAGQLARTVDAARSLDVRGTPAFVIGERLIPGLVSEGEFAALAAELRARPAE